MQANQFNTINTSELPRNLFVDYFNELNLNWAVDLNEADVLTAFHHYASIHEKLLSKVIEPCFDIENKLIAKDYLLKLCK